MELADGSITEFAVDEFPRRGTTMEALAGLKVLHRRSRDSPSPRATAPASTTPPPPSRSSVTTSPLRSGLESLATVKAWGASAVAPRDTGFGAVAVIGKILDRAGLKASDVALWGDQRAFASVPIAACREYGIDEELVNVSGSGCSLGHRSRRRVPVRSPPSSTTSKRRGVGIDCVSVLCAGGGQGGAVVIEVQNLPDRAESSRNV